MRNLEGSCRGDVSGGAKMFTLNDLDIRFIHGFGMVGQFSKNITMKDVDFATDEHSGATRLRGFHSDVRL